MKLSTRFLLENQAWADEMHAKNPSYFSQMALGQQPGVFWIGCADSRVPAESVINAAPGELFVHRAIANMALPDDLSLMSALQYAVEELRVTDVVVCGHDACGGVKAALVWPLLTADAAHDPDASYLARRIRPLQELRAQHLRELDGIVAAAGADATLAERVDRLVTLNVSAQVENLASSSVVQNAWQRGQPLRLHGWVYGLRSGRLRKIVMRSADSMEPALAQAA